VALATLSPRWRTPRRLARLGGVLWLDHVAMVAAGLTPRSTLLGPTLTRLAPEAVARGEVALTFDDGPDPEVTPRVLDLLDRAGARGTFFLIGERVARHPGLAAEIVARGHGVANHTHTHPAHFSVLLPGGLGAEIDRAQEAIERACGVVPRWFRPPAGFRSFLLEPVLARRDLHLAAWTRRGYDTRDGRATVVLQRLGRDLAPGDVLLLHDGNAAREPGTGRPVVLPVLERLLGEMGERGLRGMALP
jgi:peptidoglycan/xylan/chitin deacetylase (PgdA/CDA1 family)